MRLRGYFLILIALLIAVVGLILFDNSLIGSWKLIAVEVIIVIIFIFLFVFYKKTLYPLRVISSGMDLLREQDFSSKLRKVGQHEADKVVDIFNIMMEQLKNERLRLREQNEFLDLLIKASPMGIVVLNFDNEFSQFNPAALKILNIEDPSLLIGKKLKDSYGVMRLDIASVPLHETRTINLNDGTIYKCTHESFINQGFPRSFYLIESLTDEVRIAEKRAYAKVIRMISHEVNNTITGITTTLETVGEELAAHKESDDIQEAIKICIERSYNMSNFITNFADVVKIPKIETTPTNLNTLIRSLGKFMEVMCNKRDIKIHINSDDEFPILLLDAPLIEQVLQNIIKNSAESIEEKGDIYITTNSQELSLTIADNGKGIESDVAKRLFIPFFSTKPSGQGLGLLFIREVLTQHKCRFSLRTYPDGLTKFVIFFSAVTCNYTI